MAFFTYILQSTTSNKFYIGQTNNLDDRLFRHNSNQNLATKNKGPWQFI
ncbi:MAG: catalytic domain, partial [Bacteroidota bacterium]